MGTTKNKQKRVEVIKISPMRMQIVTFRLLGVTPLLTHGWSEENLQKLRDKHDGEKTERHGPRDREKEALDACYFTALGEYGVPALGAKKMIYKSANKEMGFPATTANKSFWVECHDPGLILPIEKPEGGMVDGYEIQEDVVRVSNKAPDLRYRPRFNQWALTLRCRVNLEFMSVSDLMNLVDRAGWVIGCGDYRPECSGDNGRFVRDPSFAILIEDM